MSKEEVEVTSVEFLIKTGSVIKTIETNLEKNRLDRNTIRQLLNEYSSLAESDGRLMNAARQEPECANRGLFLAYTHIELITWLGKLNFTIPSSSIKWYSLRQFSSKYRLPFFWNSEVSSDLQGQLDHIKKTAALVYADLQAHNISIPTTAIKYPNVPVGDPVSPPVEAYEQLLHRGTIALQVLEGGPAT
ncbi:glyoxalase family protein [Penicillium malachiteum]|uniref:Glyoxalase family protein n=1 Tax=Penicillium malachiteum TaxID=1324776 RepID=A0AAD6N078_9EURO|nr:glyoxalase family protein [Penicillium malachiteum]